MELFNDEPAYEVKTVLMHRHVGQYALFAISRNEQKRHEIRERVEHRNGSYVEYALVSTPPTDRTDSVFVPSVGDFEVLLSAMRLMTLTGQFDPDDLVDQKVTHVTVKFTNSQILADMGLARSTTGIERVKSALDNFHHLLMETKGIENRTVWSTKRGKRVGEKKTVDFSNSYYPVPKYAYVLEGDDFRSGEGYHMVMVDKTFLADCIGGTFSLQVRYDMLLLLRGAYAKALFLFFSLNKNRTTFSEGDLVRHLRIGDLSTLRRREILKRGLEEMKDKGVADWGVKHKNGELYYHVHKKTSAPWLT